MPGLIVGGVVQFVMLPKLKANAAGEGFVDADTLSGEPVTLSTAPVDVETNSLPAADDSEKAQKGLTEGETDDEAAKHELAPGDAGAEVYDPKAEWVFRYLQVFTACFMSLAHGANDVANSIGPYAAVVALYTTCTQYANTDWCVSNFGPSTYISKTHSCQCFPGYYMSSGYFSYEFDTGSGSSWQYYDASKAELDNEYLGTCGDATLTDSDKPWDEVVNPYNPQIQDTTVEPALRLTGHCNPMYMSQMSGINGHDYAEVVQQLTSFLDPEATPAYNGIYKNSAPAGSAPVLCTSSSTPVPEWIFVLGGLGIVAGLALYGKKILIAMGTKMTKITPSRGFAIDISSAFLVVVGSRIGLPLSTTHCKVGATVGVGLTEGKGAVNMDFVQKIVIGWVVTLAITGSCSAFMFWADDYARCAALDECKRVCPMKIHHFK